MSNILKAIYNICNCGCFNIQAYYSSTNRANNMGDSLEHFIKDSFANSFHDEEKNMIEKHSSVFAYLGNKNNPPDMILKGGDAIEVKKIESENSALALNSSYPKDKLYRDSQMLTSSCKNCDGGKWVEKDILYAVGVMSKNKIRKLCFIDGESYAAEQSCYKRIKVQIKKGIKEIRGLEFAETNELGRVNKVDPLGITNLRIRGMWHIVNPFRVFESDFCHAENKDFYFSAIINEKKYLEYPEEDIMALETIEGIKIESKKIRDPNNPANLKSVKVITYAR